MSLVVRSGHVRNTQRGEFWRNGMREWMPSWKGGSSNGEQGWGEGHQNLVCDYLEHEESISVPHAF